MHPANLLSQRIQHFPISKKLRLLAYCATVGLLLLTVIFLLSEKRLLMQERQNSVRQAVESSHGIIAHFHALSSQGKMTEQEAKTAALKTISALRFQDKTIFG